MKALLPVAGNGTRMYPLGLTTPKALIRILNKPLIEWTLEAMVTNQIEEVIIVISAGNFGQLIQDYVQKNIVETNKYPLAVKFAVQEQQLGTAHVAQVAKDFFQHGEEFIFCYGDDLYGPGNIEAVMNASTLAVVGKEVTDPEKWGIFKANEQGNLLHVVEKPKEFVGNLANIGCMKLSTTLFDIYDELEISVRGEYEITDSLHQLAARQPIAVVPAPDYWIPIGYPWHILDATEHFLGLQSDKVEGELATNVVRTSRLILPKSSKILPGCYLEGDILIGENTIVGPNARVRGSTVIGSNCYIGFGVEIKNTVIGNNVRIPHLAYVGDSIIGDRCNIAGGSMLANFRHDEQTIQTPIKGVMTDSHRVKLGAILGDNVRLGVNTSVYPGRKIWPSLSTRPGQVVDKDLTQ